MRNSSPYHWVGAFGIIDEDKRSPAIIDELIQKGIYAIKAYSVESIYYHPELQRRAARKLCEATTGGNVEQALHDARTAALQAIKDSRDHLCNRIVGKTLRTIVESQLPTKSNIENGQDYNIPVEVQKALNEEHSFFDELIANGDLEALICRYPIRESSTIGRILEKLNFANREQYQAAVRNIIKDDEEALKLVRSFFSTLYEDIKSDTNGTPQ